MPAKREAKAETGPPLLVRVERGEEGGCASFRFRLLQLCMALPRAAGATTTKKAASVQSLQELSTHVVATSLDKYASLGVLPLEVVALILNRTLSLGLLTPHSFKLFLETGHHVSRASLSFLPHLSHPPLRRVWLTAFRSVGCAPLLSFQPFARAGRCSQEIREVFERLEARETHIPVLPTRCGQR